MPLLKHFRPWLPLISDSLKSLQVVKSQRRRIKNTFWKCLLNVLILASGFIEANAAQLPPRPPSLAVNSIPGFPGTTITVPIVARQTTNVVAAQFDVAYNSVKVTSGEATLSARHRNHVVRSREIAPGVRRTLVYSLNNALLLTNGFSAGIPFRISAQERSSGGQVKPENVHLIRRDGLEISPLATSSGTIFVNSVNRLPDGTAQLFLPSQADKDYVIQATSDFVSWINITNVVASGAFMDLVDEDAKNYSQRFYRWIAPEYLGELLPVSVSTGREFVFQVAGLAGRTYDIETSTNLIQWQHLRTVSVGSGTLQITNVMGASETTRFYRLNSRP